MTDVSNSFYRISVKALILNEEKKFLLLLEENGLWELPGGGLHYGEKPETCLKRELKEETGLDVTYIQKQPSYFITGLNSQGNWKANIIYRVKIKNLVFTPSDECIELRFFSKEEAMRENLYPTISTFIKEYNPSLHTI